MVATLDQPKRENLLMENSRVQHRPSLLAHVLITAAVALVAGVTGAIGYSYFLGSGAAQPTKSERIGQAESNGQAPVPGSAAPASTGDPKSSAAGSEMDDLKAQIMGLSKRIDKLTERVDRLQELLSLAVPLMQRLAPKQ